MTSDRNVRIAHRRLALLFTLVVLANVVSAIAGGPDWVGYVALVPLVLMMLSGWYMLAAPHLTGRRTSGQ
jgi:fatty-acid desaturase